MAGQSKILVSIKSDAPTADRIHEYICRLLFPLVHREGQGVFSSSGVVNRGRILLVFPLRGIPEGKRKNVA